MPVLGALLLLAVVWVLGQSNTPPSLERLSGAIPQVESFKQRCTYEEAGLTGCSRATSYRWQLPADGSHLATTWRISRPDSTAVRGVLVHAGCPGSRVEWTMITNDSTVGTLTGQTPTVELYLPVHGDLRQLTVELRRLDSDPCPSTFTWDDPVLDKPAFSLAPSFG